MAKVLRRKEELDLSSSGESKTGEEPDLFKMMEFLDKLSTILEKPMFKKTLEKYGQGFEDRMGLKGKEEQSAGNANMLTIQAKSKTHYDVMMILNNFDEKTIGSLMSLIGTWLGEGGLGKLKSTIQADK